MHNQKIIVPSSPAPASTPIIPPPHPSSLIPLTHPSKVLLGHDWLTGMRGGERVLELLCETFPDAELFTLIHNEKAVSEQISKHVSATSWLQHIPGIFKYYRYALPLFPKAIESIRIPEADLLITTNHCVAKGLQKHKNTRHLCYCFTPMRYAWLFFDEYFGGNKIKKMTLSPILSYLRKWDLQSTEKVDRFVAISAHIQKRIEKFYHRPSDIVYPPVDTQRLTPQNNSDQDFDLIVSALVPYKRVDLAVDAYNQLKRPLKIVGTGTEYEILKEKAGNNITFEGWQSDETIKQMYQQCRCLIFPGEEDFGIVPVEAQACGRPVVAYAKGGALETVQDGKTGIFFSQQTVESLIEGIEKVSRTAWDKATIRKNAERFSTEKFLRGIHRQIDLTLA